MEENSALYILYIITGVLAIIFTFFILIWKKRNLMLIFKLADDVLWSLNFFFKGAIAFTGCAQNGIAIAREIIFYFKGKKKWASHPIWLILFILFFATMPIYTWAGWISILPAIASILSTIGFYFKNPFHTRLINLAVQSISITYAVLVWNIFSLICASVMLLSAIIGLIIDLVSMKKKKDEVKIDENQKIIEENKELKQ